MKTSTKIIAAVLLVVGSTTAVYAFSKHGHWHMEPQEKVEFVTERVTDKLELDSQQQQNFRSLANTVAQMMMEAKAARADQMAEISAMLQEPSFNQARALEIIEQKTRLVNEKAPLVVSSMAIFLDSLNADQKQQLQEMIEHHRKHQSRPVLLRSGCRRKRQSDVHHHSRCLGERRHHHRGPG